MKGKGVQVNYFKNQEVIRCYQMIMKLIQSKLLMIKSMRSLLILRHLITIVQKHKQLIKLVNLVLTWLLAQIKQNKSSVLKAKISNLMFANALCSDQIILQYLPVSTLQLLFHQASQNIGLLSPLKTQVCNYSVKIKINVLQNFISRTLKKIQNKQIMRGLVISRN